MTKRAGDNLTLSINITANPPVSSYNWSKNGVPLESDERIKLNDATIQFTKLLPSDLDNYTLTVSNVVGTNNSTFLLNVLCK